MDNIRQMVSRLINSSRVNYTLKLNVDESILNEYLPTRELASRALVYHDLDLRTAQYWGSCGTAATIVQLRHLHPRRLERLSIRGRERNNLTDTQSANEYTDEIALRERLGQRKNFLFDGAAGRPKIDQAWLFAETRNSIDKLKRILTGPGSNLRLKPHTRINNEIELEAVLMKVLSNNHLAYVSIDGAFQSSENYPFPTSREEWRQRSKFGTPRPTKQPCRHWIIDYLWEIFEEQCGGHSQARRQFEGCSELRELIQRLDHILECPTHAITVTGVYEFDTENDYFQRINEPSTEIEKPYRLFRVLDSNPGPNLYNSIYNPSLNLRTQGAVRYMTPLELWNHMSTMRQRRVLEWTTDGRGICGANKLQPLYFDWGMYDIDLSDYSFARSVSLFRS